MDKQETLLPPKQSSRRVMEAAMDAGHILLESGAEISRVEETMDRICRHFGVASDDFFVLSNGIFATGGHGTPEQYARVQHIPVTAARLDRVVAVNQLSREIAMGQHSIESVEARLEEIRAMQPQKGVHQVLASAIGSACFCYLFGGGFADSAAAFLSGLVLYIFVLKAARRMSKMIGNICGGALVTLICIACQSVGFGSSLSHMIIGSVIPLIPGVAFTNGIRDIGDGDYISGAVRLLDAILVFLCIAIGVGLVFAVYHRVTGGAML